MAKALKNTFTYRVFDIDGNCVASFMGYSFPTWAQLMAAAKTYENAMKIIVYNRKGEVSETQWVK